MLSSLSEKRINREALSGTECPGPQLVHEVHADPRLQVIRGLIDDISLNILNRAYLGRRMTI
jgi:hypothetical protein